MYKAKGKQNALEGYFVRCKSDVTNYHEMPVELWIHILFFFWPIQQNLRYVNEKRTSCNILHRLLLFHFPRARSRVFFSFISEITARLVLA